MLSQSTAHCLHNHQSVLGTTHFHHKTSCLIQFITDSGTACPLISGTKGWTTRHAQQPYVGVFHNDNHDIHPLPFFCRCALHLKFVSDESRFKRSVDPNISCWDSEGITNDQLRDDRLPEPTTQVPHPTIVRYSLIIAQFDHITRSTICPIAAAHWHTSTGSTGANNVFPKD